eukprot:scaffold57025_cov23-Cyclotella_meneghiniana.AAC.1
MAGRWHGGNVLVATAWASMCDCRGCRQQHYCPLVGHPSTCVPGMFGGEVMGKHNNQSEREHNNKQEKGRSHATTSRRTCPGRCVHSHPSRVMP